MARLHARIYAHFIGVLLVVAITTAVVFGLGVRDAFRQQAALSLARHVSSLLSERFSDPSGLAARVEQLHDDLAMSVCVYGDAGQMLARAGEPLPPLSSTAKAQLRGGRELLWTRHMGFAAPIRRPGSTIVVGFVEFGPRHPPGLPGIWRPLLWVAVALAVVALATRPLAQRISRPLERLTAAVRRLGGGDLTARVPTQARHARRSDEIGELTRAFNEMAERVERLVRSEKELLANVSHELRSPLARVRLALELLPHGAADAPRLRDVERDLTELERLTDDVLTAARLGATGLPARLEEIDARAILEDVAERARHDPLLAGVELRLDRGVDVRITADGGLLRRALWNLVENAAKYGAPPIRLSAACDGDRVTLVVSDEGAGIAPAEREQVFAPFYRGEAARGRERPGVGLGLTLARRVAEAHGGTVALAPASEDGGRARGTRVVMSLPRTPPPQDGERAPE